MTLLVSAAAAVALFGGVAVGAVALNRPSGVDALGAAPDAHSARESVTGGGAADVVWSPSEHRAAVRLDDLPALSGGRVYQLWYIDRVGIATSAGLVDADGTDRNVTLDGRLSHGDRIGITVEKKGGADAPTGPTILEVQTA